jgi:hypothetical protein
MTTPKNISSNMHLGRFAGVFFGLHLWVYHAGSGQHLASRLMNGFWTKAAPYIKLMSLSGAFSGRSSSLRK